ncbi:hypothetical protein JW859_04050 [bacterium]|nr:hypothetical protein [bacterium]
MARSTETSASSGATGRATSRNASSSAKAKARGQRQPKDSAAQPSIGREIALSLLGCLWIIVGLGITGASAGVWYGSRLAIEVLDEIGERDYSGPQEQITRYESFFDSLNPELYLVEEIKPSIDLGKTSLGWVVMLRGSQERRRFQWEHDLQQREVYPRTNPALCLDVKLGLIKAEDAQSYSRLETSREKYNPDDPIVNAILLNNFSLVQAGDLTSGWLIPEESPVGAPLISPAEGKGRQYNATHPEEETEANPEDDWPETQPNDATNLIGGDEADDTN